MFLDVCVCARARESSRAVVSLALVVGSATAWPLRNPHPPHTQFEQGKLEAARDGVAGAAAELASGLQRRQAVAAARALLELMQVGGGRRLRRQQLVAHPA